MDQIAATEAAIARGKVLTTIEQQISELRAQLAANAARQSARKRQSFAFGQPIRFVETWGNHELVADGIVLRVGQDVVEIAYRVYLPGQGEQTGVMSVEVSNLQLA